MLIVFLFGLILSVSPMTAIRGEAAVGPLDIAMVAVAILTFLVCFRPSALLPTAKYPMSPTRNLFEEPVAKFWICAIPVLVASTLIQISSDDMLLTSLGRDTLSLGASILTTLAASAAFVSRFRWALMSGICAGAAATATAYSIAALTGSIGYNIDGRFIGASLNPNQTALQALAFICIAYTVSKAVPFIAVRVAMFVTIVCSAAFGLATQSDALRIAALPLGLALLFAATEKLLGNRGKAIVSIIFLGVAALALVQLTYPDFITAQWYSVTNTLQDGNQDIDRFSLWKNGVSAWQESIILGNGIGAWSGIAGPFEGIEAHNSFIDWLSISGIAGSILYIILIFSIFKFKLYYNLETYLIFSSLMLYSTFGFFFRNPIYWITLITILTQSHYTISIRQSIYLRSRNLSVSV
jgi:hypothetical protein